VKGAEVNNRCRSGFDCVRLRFVILLSVINVANLMLSSG